MACMSSNDKCPSGNFGDNCCGINIEKENTVQKKCTFCGGTNHFAEKCFKRIRKEKEKSHAVESSDNRQTERLPRKCFRCGSEDHLIAKYSKPPKDNKKRQRQVRFNEKVNRICDNGKNNDDHKIYASMARMSSNGEKKN